MKIRFLASEYAFVRFDWKDGGMHDLGLGAEDVAAIEPLLVTYNAKGEVEGVKYDRIGVVLVNAVKEQQARIEALEAALCSLKPRLAICSKNKLMRGVNAHPNANRKGR